MSTSRRLLTILSVLSVLAIVGLFTAALLYSPRAPGIILPTGESVELSGTSIGGGFAIPESSPVREMVNRWTVRLGRGAIFNQPIGTGSSSWFSLIPRDRALNAWFVCSKGFDVDYSAGNGKHHAGIVTEDGWLWPAVGSGIDRSAPMGGGDLRVLAFTQYPRWSKEITVRFYRNDTKASVGELIIPHPGYQPHPIHSWIPQALVQTALVSGVEFSLKSLKWYPDWRSNDPTRPKDGYKFPPTVDPQVEVREPGASNRWKRVWMLVEDNYGNVWNSGLPPRVTGKTTGPRTIWRMRMWYCAADSSLAATNSHFIIPNLTVPPALQAARLPVTNFIVGDVNAIFCGLVGPAYVTYSNGVLVATNPTTMQRTSISQSSSTSFDGKVRNRTQHIDAGVPHVALALDSKLTSPNLYYSLMVSNPATGDRRFLGSYMKPQTSPEFTSFSETNTFAVGQLGGVITNWPSFNLTVGIHQPLVVDFYIEQPEVAPQ